MGGGVRKSGREEVPVQTGDVARGRRTDFLIPSPMHGSGGHRTAVSAGEALARRGFDVHLHFERAAGLSDADVHRQAAEWHGAKQCAVHADWPSDLRASDAVIGTTWQSAVAVARLMTGAVRMHFVQDYEAWFHAMGDEHLAALGVHELGLPSIVIGNWLQVQLRTRHDLRAWTIPFTADLSTYQGAGSDSRRPRTVVAMYQPDKPRRCGNLMSSALKAVLEADPDAEVVTVGSPRSPALGLRHRHLGIVTKEELAGVYAEASVGLSISSSNPSRVPFEMMAAGLPVVELGVANNRYDLPDDGCILAHPDPSSLASAMLGILHDDGLRSRLSEGGQRFMRRRPAAAEGDAFVAAVEAAIAGRQPPDEIPAECYQGTVVRDRGRAPWDGTGSIDSGQSHFADPLTEQVRVNEELNRANAELNLTNEELNRANAELNSTNEELNRTNEELNRASGELNLTNEELNRTNEELNRANTELHRVNHALAQENQDLTAEAEQLRWRLRHPIQSWTRRISAAPRSRN